MRLIYLRVDRALSCGGLLDGAELAVTRPHEETSLAPLCFIGPNGAGKSQLLQLIAEIFQVAWHQYAGTEERLSSNNESLFEVRYRMSSPAGLSHIVKLVRESSGRTVGPIRMEFMRDNDEEWRSVAVDSPSFGENLPSLVIGYTSGDNETLSLPFFVSRRGYAADVSEAALPNKSKSRSKLAGEVPDNRLLLIDYSTHLEVLVANLLLSPPSLREKIIGHAKLHDLASFRCVIQLNHSAAPSGGVKLTPELRAYIDIFRKLATCWDHEPKKDIHTFDFFVDDALREGFAHHFETAGNLYRAFHKISLLNDLAIPRAARNRLQRDIDSRRFASRLPEPQDEDKVFRFEQVSLCRHTDEGVRLLDYVSLSDGEHQLSQILGIFSMIDTPGALFVLDEPESHFNPLWRVQFTKSLLNLPNETRGHQEVLLTTHAPFVPCDLPREQVLIFSKNANGKVEIAPPEMETYGASFDRILDACFEVSPPISQVAQDEMEHLIDKGTAAEIADALTRLGPSVERSFLADRLRQLRTGS
ncbi:restriction system-associated AAA family ATPase [Rhizobium bangladeshense]|uniref:restriction system-associated AAA family ATPase n=1 Tax=Rhizobium bangladeshense TaxID=1138189 RepID=UPI001A9A11AF|nr:restriction system-associated AAA family ATPase [Rhizobium bangladeshense]MBX4930570.1 restriction system-associated AAA family ATPase [Rhizobium bangladeshense]MBY3581128.1 restriction system-associated AAA family ATPase [Rhizobium bangladeshense]QSY87203.1 restriction system-associated AAA family ATPase [Rhizobium bangladeshense]